jgi:CAAX prenyl protease-like protein
MALGVEFSPEVAINGFHTNAGSIAMVLSCAAVMGLVHWGFVARASNSRDSAAARRLGWSLDFESVLLLPLMALLAATLLTGAASGRFVWLYPLRVLAVGAVLACCWPHLKSLNRRLSVASIAIGAAVFAVWMALVPNEPETDRLFGESLGSVDPVLATAWVAFRVLGAVITVPIAEELAFRGYLLTVLSRRPVQANQPLPFDWLGLAGSSLLFGLMHGQVLAGTLAGLGYAWARYRRGRLVDAVVAHTTTNLLLAIYVLASGRWSYW